MHLPENLEETRNQQKLLIFHIRISIDNISNYVKSRKVSLPQDRHIVHKVDDSKETVDIKLERVKTHIDDLIAIVNRVQHHQLEEHYSHALHSKMTRPC